MLVEVEEEEDEDLIIVDQELGKIYGTKED